MAETPFNPEPQEGQESAPEAAPPGEVPAGSVAAEEVPAEAPPHEAPAENEAPAESEPPPQNEAPAEIPAEPPLPWAHAEAPVPAQENGAPAEPQEQEPATQDWAPPEASPTESAVTATPEPAPAPAASEPVAPPSPVEPTIAATLEVPPAPAPVGGAEGEGGEFELLLEKLRSWFGQADLPGQWERLGGPLRALGLLVGALVVLRLYQSVLDTLEDIPLLPRLLQLAGLIALIRFSLTRLVRTNEREALLSNWKRRWSDFTGRH